MPLWKTKNIEGNAVAADVLNRKTFSTADGVHMGGRSISVEDWRMPTVREMNSLLAYSRCSGQIAGSNALVIPNFFTDVHSNIYWTNSLADSLCSNGQGGFYRCNIDFAVDLRYATINHEILDPNDQSPPQHYCWCVRGP